LDEISDEVCRAIEIYRGTIETVDALEEPDFDSETPRELEMLHAIPEEEECDSVRLSL
jgi:hypothetical protein